MPIIDEILGELANNIQQKRDNNGLIQQLMANRMQPSMQDVQQTSYMRGMNPTEAIMPEQVMAERFKNQLSPYAQAASIAQQQQQERFAPYTAMASLMNAQTAAGGGPTGMILNRLAAANPALADPAKGLALYKGLAGQGMTVDPTNGSITNIPGAVNSAANMAGGKRSAEEQAVLNYAAPIEAAKVVGRGDITDLQKRTTGQQNVASTAATLENLYNQLEGAGAAVSTKQTGLQNLSARTRSGVVGQALGRTFGTQEQSIRNQIGMQIPNLINDIRSATGMSAKAMDSNAELQFYLKMATDPNADIEANRAALTTIRQKYLAGGQSPAASTAPSAGNIPTFSGPNDPGFQSLPPGTSFKTQDGRTMVKH